MSDEFIYTFESAEVIVSHIPALNRRKSSNFPFRSVILHKYTIFSYICQTITEKNRRSRYIRKVLQWYRTVKELFYTVFLLFKYENGCANGLTGK